MICDMADINSNDIKVLAQAFLSDTYYKATRREIIIIGNTVGITSSQLGSYLDMTRQGVNKYLRTNKTTFTPIPRCNIEDDYKIVTFLKALDKFRQLGRLGDGAINESTV